MQEDHILAVLAIAGLIGAAAWVGVLLSTRRARRESVREKC